MQPQGSNNAVGADKENGANTSIQQPPEEHPAEQMFEQPMNQD